MIRNYLTVAIRNLKRQKLYAFINIFGLALGIACCTLIFIYVQFEWSFDRFHKNQDVIYRLIAKAKTTKGKISRYVLHEKDLVETLKTTQPNIVHASGYVQSSVRLSYQDQYQRETIGLVSPDFLKMFSFPLLAGNIDNIFQHPNSVVISESTAHFLFGQTIEDYTTLLDKVITFHQDENYPYVIAGIVKDFPKNSSIQVDALISLDHVDNFGRSQNDNGYAHIYIQFADTQNAQIFIENALPFVQSHLAEKADRFRSHKWTQDVDDAYTLDLEHLTDMHWATSSRGYITISNPDYFVILASIGLLILIIASINYMTLSVGQSMQRTREVGMRKVLGAQKSQLMRQFWGEAILASLIALCFGLAFTELLFPAFKNLVQKPLSLQYIDIWLGLAYFISLIVFIGFVVGSYPAVVLSQYHPIETLKGQTKPQSRSHLTRALVVIQYTLSIGLLTSLGIMTQQISFMKTQNLGFDQEQVVVLRQSGDHTTAVYNRFREKLLTYPQIISVGGSDRSFPGGYSTVGLRNPDGKRVQNRIYRIDTHYLETLKIPLIAGRNFSSDRLGDEKSVIVNESFVKKYGWENPIGQPIKGFNYIFSEPKVIGVVKDFYYQDLRQPLYPLIMHMNPRMNGMNAIFVRFQPSQATDIVDLLRTVWSQVAPDRPFRFSFLNENIDNQYRSEQRWQKIMTYSSFFTIAISCLGLLGLASLAVSRRTKEIGIRKTLGASIPNLVNLLSADFIRLLLLSNIIAWPLVYYAMDKWLANFAYRIDLSIEIFVLSGILALAVALLTVSTQTLKAARSNPVDALRSE